MISGKDVEDSAQAIMAALVNAKYVSPQFDAATKKHAEELGMSQNRLLARMAFEYAEELARERMRRDSQTQHGGPNDDDGK